MCVRVCVHACMCACVCTNEGASNDLSMGRFAQHSNAHRWVIQLRAKDSTAPHSHCKKGRSVNDDTSAV